MKKFLSVMIVCCICLGITACGNSNSPGEDSEKAKNNVMDASSSNSYETDPAISEEPEASQQVDDHYRFSKKVIHIF